ncbi:DNA-binding protein [Mycolicibacter engbaekii]|uniref:DNA-binding protein n=1 Tax=Mycolicibacter engbaekii TaxID=188915 RepID=UPI00105507E8|nr:DNA-binding protein [Mycolicibacter engbaekii]
MTAAISYDEGESPQNPPWRLTDRNIAALLHACEEYSRTAAVVSPAVTEAAWKLSAMTVDLAAMSRRHRPARDRIGLMDNDAQTIDTGEAARILGRHPRWVQRHRQELGGYRDGRGRLRFDAAAITAYHRDHSIEGDRHAHTG